MGGCARLRVVLVRVEREGEVTGGLLGGRVVPRRSHGRAPNDRQDTTSPSTSTESRSSVWSPRSTPRFTFTLPVSPLASESFPPPTPFRMMKAGSPVASSVTVSWAPAFTVSPDFVTAAVIVTLAAATPVA